MAKVNVISVLKTLDLQFDRAGNRNEFVLDCVDPSCPSPNNHLYLNSHSGLWVCHRCGVTGNITTLVSIVKQMTMTQAAKYLGARESKVPEASELRLKISEITNMEENIREMGELKSIISMPPKVKPVTVLQYPVFLKERDIPLDLIEKVNAHMCNAGKYSGRLIFPFECAGNRSFVAYATSKAAQRKTMNPFGSDNSSLIYLYDQICKEYHSKKTLIIVEGIFDSLRLLCYGYACMALLGSYLAKNQALLINQTEFENVVFMLDGDVRLGEYSKKLRNIKYIPDKTVFFAPIPDYNKDPDDLSAVEVKWILVHGTELAESLYQIRHKIRKIKDNRQL